MEPAYQLYFQQQTKTSSGGYYRDGDVVDIFAKWGIACKEFPFEVFSEMKDLPTYDWKDEDGEEVYLPTDSFRRKAYDLDVEFIWSGLKAQMHSKIVGFLNYLFCRVDADGESRTPCFLGMYDEYTGIGLRGVVAKKHSSEMYWHDVSDTEGIATFKVTFRVTDPNLHGAL